jgi:hypothetical protein
MGLPDRRLTSRSATHRTLLAYFPNPFLRAVFQFGMVLVLPRTAGGWEGLHLPVAHELFVGGFRQKAVPRRFEPDP